MTTITIIVSVISGISLAVLIVFIQRYKSLSIEKKQAEKMIETLEERIMILNSSLSLKNPVSFVGLYNSVSGLTGGLSSRLDTNTVANLKMATEHIAKNSNTIKSKLSFISESK